MGLIKAGVPSNRLILFICKNIVNSSYFRDFEAAHQHDILKLLSDLTYFSPSISALTELSSTSQLALLNEIADFSSTSDYSRLEPILNCLYKSQMNVNVNSHNPPQICEVLRQIYSSSQIAKISLAESDKQNALLICSNVHAFARELLKPYSARSQQQAILSWNRSFTQTSNKEILLSAKLPAEPDSDVSISSSAAVVGFKPIIFDIPSIKSKVASRVDKKYGDSKRKKSAVENKQLKDSLPLPIRKQFGRGSIVAPIVEVTHMKVQNKVYKKSSAAPNDVPENIKRFLKSKAPSSLTQMSQRPKIDRHSIQVFSSERTVTLLF